MPERGKSGAAEERGDVWTTEVRRRPDGTARWDVWYDGQHVAGAVECSGAVACEKAGLWLRVNDIAAGVQQS